MLVSVPVHRNLLFLISHNYFYFKNCKVGNNIYQLFLFINDYIFKEVRRVLKHVVLPLDPDLKSVNLRAGGKQSF